jgi:hypothetical protein
MGYTEGEKAPSDGCIRTKARHLEEYLYICELSLQGNGTTIVEILFAMLKRGSMTDIYT